MSTDVFAVIVKTPPDGCIDYDGLARASELEWRMRELEGVEDVRGLKPHFVEDGSGLCPAS